MDIAGLDAFLGRGREAAESLMVDTCSIRRRTGTTVDDNTGEEAVPWDEVYTGKCRVQQASLGGSATAQTPGEDHQLLMAVEMQLPMAVTGLQVGDEITIIASVHDPDLVDEVFLVRDLFAKTHATARRVGVTRRTS